uniref:IQ motif containing with AAA domain 1 like n=1 Tax=Rousettus aegyptiacus TaxID=9407 RepID=A0A7J8D635_ROUAE|nr:IQ motif containing with AAA domain 1 like [Rousettus aegyptiacus]
MPLLADFLIIRMSL